jgi:hypothetical protein
MRAKGKKPAPSSKTESIEARVDALAEVLRRHELTEIEIEEGGVRIYVRRGGGETLHHVQAPMAVPVHAPMPTSHAPPPTGSGAPPPPTATSPT